MKLTNKSTVLDGWKPPKQGREKQAGTPGTLRRGARKLLRPDPPSRAIAAARSVGAVTKRGADKLWEKDKPGIIRRKIIAGLVKIERTIGGVNVS